MARSMRRKKEIDVHWTSDPGSQYQQNIMAKVIMKKRKREIRQPLATGLAFEWNDLLSAIVARLRSQMQCSG